MPEKKLQIKMAVMISMRNTSRGPTLTKIKSSRFLIHHGQDLKFLLLLSRAHLPILQQIILAVFNVLNFRLISQDRGIDPSSLEVRHHSSASDQLYIGCYNTIESYRASPFPHFPPLQAQEKFITSTKLYSTLAPDLNQPVKPKK